MTRSKKTSRNRGFSLVELMVVIAIIGVLAATVTVSLLKRAEKAKATRVQADFKSLDTAISTYKLDTGRYPDALEDLIREPGGVSNWDGPYLKSRSIPKDPWDRDYLYEYPGSQGGYELRSLGADGAEGGEGENEDHSSYDVLQ